MPIKSTLEKHLVIVTLKVYKSAFLQPKKILSLISNQYLELFIHHSVEKNNDSKVMQSTQGL